MYPGVRNNIPSSIIRELFIPLSLSEILDVREKREREREREKIIKSIHLLQKMLFL